MVYRLLSDCVFGRGLKGVTVGLGEDGRLSCSYFGSDPSMTSHPSAYLRELDYASVETEMKQLQRVIKEHQSKSCKTLLLVSYAAVLRSRITGLARQSVCPSCIGC